MILRRFVLGFLHLEFYMSESNDISAALSGEERQEMAEKLTIYQDKLAALPADTTPLERALLQLDISELQLALDLKEDSWNSARATFDTFIQNEQITVGSSPS